MYETLVWATDGSEGADAALAEVLRLSELTGARVVAVHCDQRFTGFARELAAQAGEADRVTRIEEQVEELKAEDVDIELIVRHTHSEAADVIAEVAGEVHADAILCGTRGMDMLAGAILGSVTQRLLHVAPCTVVAVRDRADRRSSSRPPTRAITHS